MPSSAFGRTTSNLLATALYGSDSSPCVDSVSVYWRELVLRKHVKMSELFEDSVVLHLRARA